MFTSGMGGGRGESFFAKGDDVNAKITVSLEEAFHGANKTIRRPTGAAQAGTVNVKIPAGVSAGQKIRLAGQGKAGLGDKAGDLYLEIQIAQHAFFEIVDKDLYLDLPLAPWEAALGTKVTVPTLAGKISLTIPAGARSGLLATNLSSCKFRRRQQAAIRKRCCTEKWPIVLILIRVTHWTKLFKGLSAS